MRLPPCEEPHLRQNGEACEGGGAADGGKGACKSVVGACSGTVAAARLRLAASGRQRARLRWPAAADAFGWRQVGATWADRLPAATRRFGTSKPDAMPLPPPRRR